MEFAILIRATDPKSVANFSATNPKTLWRELACVLLPAGRYHLAVMAGNGSWHIVQAAGGKYGSMGVTVRLPFLVAPAAARDDLWNFSVSTAEWADSLVSMGRAAREAIE